MRPLLALALALPLSAADLTLERAPEGGIQPQAVTGPDGAVHLICYRGAEAAGDVFYYRRAPGAAAFGPGLRVDSAPGSAVAVGSIRGAQLALGRDGWVHVAWNGAQRATPAAPEGSPMLYARKAAKAATFEPQRNLLTWATGLDGGGTLAADAKGGVVVAWHAGPGKAGEEKRSVYVARSADDGRSFAKEADVIATPTGACGCCGMRAAFAGDGGLALLYRAATGGMQRDMVLAWAAPGAAQAKPQRLDSWTLGTCPLSTSAIARAGDGLLIAWQGENGLSWARVAGGTAAAPIAFAGAGAKHPAIAQGPDGGVMVVWTEGTGWKRGGSLHWQAYRADGTPDGGPGSRDGVAVWSIPTVIATGPGKFAAWY